jgi:hypothetical protein
MPAGFVIHWKNGQEWAFDLSRWIDEFTDFTPVWNDLKPALQESCDNAFKEEGTREGVKYPALSPGYKKWKEGYIGKKGQQCGYKGPRGKYFPKIMTLSGRLYRALTGTTSDSIFKTKPRSMIFGARVETDKGFDYGGAHQDGSAKGGKVRKTLDPDIIADRSRAPYKRFAISVQQHFVKTAFKNHVSDKQENIL